MPENHAGKPTKVIATDSSSKLSENVVPQAATASVGDVAPGHGVPLFTFSKTSFSVL